MKAVLVTGPMRSGTSLVAQIANRLGFHAGIIGAPIPPAWRSDWEDIELSTKLLSDRPISPAWWSGYRERRLALARTCGMRGIVLKSPYLALRWAEAREAFPDAVTIVLRRDPERVARSFFAHRHLLTSAAQDAIHGALARIAPLVDCVVDYDALVRDPLIGVGEIAEVLGVEDAEAREAAAALVEKPREYATWQSLQV